MQRADSGARSRDDILREAVRLFSRKGYTGTSMRDIADAVGLLPGSLYAHIDDKEGVLVEIVNQGIDAFLHVGERVVAGPQPPEVRMRALIRAHVDLVAENLERTNVVFHQWKHLSAERRGVVVDKRDRYEALFIGLVDDGIAAGAFNAAISARIAVLSILGILNWLPEWLSPDGPEPVDEVAARVTDIVLFGLHGRPARS
jgi:TetR/AcrR family transcriptional regulator, cholesterol catabolism regulator